MASIDKFCLHLTNKVAKALSAKHCVVSVVNNALFVCVYGVGFEIEDTNATLLELLEINDGYDSLMYFDSRYYKVSRDRSTIKRRALARGDTMLTYVVNITDLTPQ
ncbi:hypothetical protein D5b_00252 [Faustovirus]|nr:hypothetical protein D5b_00252 [Faustovirus]